MRIFGELQDGDRVEADAARARLNLASVKSLLAVASPKGGSGKSALTVNLAATLASAGRKVGIVDADLNAPSVTAMLGVKVPRYLPMTEGIEPVSGPLGIRVVSGEFLPEVQPPPPISFVELADTRAEPAREPLEASHGGALARMLAQTRFGNLDLLVVDLAPGFDRLHRLASVIMPTGVLLVTRASGEDARGLERILAARERLGLPLLGVVENMVGFNCVNCRSVRPLFPEGQVSRVARAAGIEIVARLPFDPRFAESTERGRVFVQEYGDQPIAKQIVQMARRVDALINARAAEVRDPIVLSDAIEETSG
jgi:ATP-binding protein involved in chromosome partitioning